MRGWDQLDSSYGRLFAQEAEENAYSYYGNHGRCCNAWENDAKILEAVEARGSLRDSVRFHRRLFGLLPVGRGWLLSTNARKDLLPEIGGWRCGRGCRLEGTVHLPMLFEFTLAIRTGIQMALDLSGPLRFKPA
jgi:hypothetical protein